MHQSTDCSGECHKATRPGPIVVWSGLPTQSSTSGPTHSFGIPPQGLEGSLPLLFLVFVLVLHLLACSHHYPPPYHCVKLIFYSTLLSIFLCVSFLVSLLLILLPYSCLCAALFFFHQPEVLWLVKTI